MNPRTSAHPAGEALAAVRAENPQLADKLKLATGPAEQLGLFAAAQDAPPKAVSLGLKDHDWDRQHPISKTAYSVVYFCTRCNVRMRANLGTRPQYRAGFGLTSGPCAFRSLAPALRPIRGPSAALSRRQNELAGDGLSSERARVVGF